MTKQAVPPGETIPGALLFFGWQEQQGAILYAASWLETSLSIFRVPATVILLAGIFHAT